MPMNSYRERPHKYDNLFSVLSERPYRGRSLTFIKNAYEFIAVYSTYQLFFVLCYMRTEYQGIDTVLRRSCT